MQHECNSILKDIGDKSNWILYTHTYLTFKDYSRSLMAGSSNQPLLAGVNDDEGNEKLASKVRIESKKLWHIVGPSIFSRLSAYSMNLITQAFAGHLGNVELAAVSISVTVIAGFNYGFLVFSLTIHFFLSLHETFLCDLSNSFVFAINGLDDLTNG